MAVGWDGFLAAARAAVQAAIFFLTAVCSQPSLAPDPGRTWSWGCVVVECIRHQVLAGQQIGAMCWGAVQLPLNDAPEC